MNPQGQGSAHIIIENGSIKKLPQKVKPLGRVFAVVTDQHLKTLGEKIMADLRRAGATAHLLVLPAGEKTKSLSFVEKMASSLARLGVKRDGVLVAVGGGVVGDVTGFLASVYMRGIALVAAPTTLLAMADSSVGGKTGANLPEGKNLVGTFYHPRLILMDPALLQTLPDREYRGGLAEVVKHAVIADRKFFSFLEKNALPVLKRKPAVLAKIIRRSVGIKLGIVRRDPHESPGKISGASRMLLNYGHTVGHALERLSHFEIPHGEAVAMGMVAENRVAVGKNLLKENEAARILALLKALRLPSAFPKEFSSGDVKRAFATDKKHLGGRLCFALPVRIGKAKIVTL